MPAHKGEIPSTQSALLLRLKERGPSREAAWRAFREAYAPVIAGFARRMGARWAEIDDVVQEVMAGFHAAAPQFQYDRTKGRFRGYLKTCTWRKLQRGVGARLKLGGKALDEIDAGDASVEEAWTEAWERAKLQQALELVRTQYAARRGQRRTFEAFEHYALLERPAADVARELGMTVDGVHQAKTRIVRALRDAMAGLEAFAE